MDGWINLYKPIGISSAKAVSFVKRLFPGDKVGHSGTLDLEAEGVLPIAVGEATKLVSFLMDAQKTYKFTIQFGARTDSADKAGAIIERSDYLPLEQECHDICQKFMGTISQTPPAYSALKVNGQRAYKLARCGKEVVLLPREVKIYQLECTHYNPESSQASFVATCSKGTYIRTLAEDISLSLKSLGYVIELARLKVGDFCASNSVNSSELLDLSPEQAKILLEQNYMKVESVLDDIPVLEADANQVWQIFCGQESYFDTENDMDKIWVKHQERLVAIGSIKDKRFLSSRVFNLIKKEKKDVDNNGA